MKNYILPIIVALLVGLIVGYMIPDPTSKVGASAVGTLNSTPRMVQIAMAGVSTSTWASFYNSDENERAITSIDIVIRGTSGVGSTSPETLQCATSTNAYDLNSNTNYILNGALGSNNTVDVFSLSTSTAVIGATGVLATSSNARIWASGSYLNCVAASKALWTSTTTGSMRVNYMTL